MKTKKIIVLLIFVGISCMLTNYTLASESVCHHFYWCTSPGVCALCGETVNSYNAQRNHSGNRVPYNTRYHHWSCCDAPEEHLSDCRTPRTCKDCGYEGNIMTEHLGYRYESDSTYHWLECSNCGYVTDYDTAPHIAYCHKPTKCATCDRDYSGNNLDHDWYYNYGEYHYDENSHWRKCGRCGARNNQAHAIDYGNYDYSESTHWLNCNTCDYTTNISAHYANCNTPYKCAICNTNYNGTNIQHSEITINSYAATCTNTGLTEGKKCTVCGITTVEQTIIPAKGHTEEPIPGKAATCTESGLTDGKKCTVCGVTTVEQATIPADGHNEETIPGKPATCTATGLTDGKKCTVCGITTVEQTIIPAKGHSEETIPGKPATCTESGLTDGKRCSICNEMLESQEEISWDHKTHAGTKSLAFYDNSYHCERWSCCGRWEGSFYSHYLNCANMHYGATCAGCGDGFLDPAEDEVRHSGNRILEHNKTHHWYFCDACGNEITREEHSGRLCNDYCTVCGIYYSKGHDMHKVSYNGFFHDRKCSKCGHSDGLESCIVRCIDSNTCDFCGGHSSIMPHCSYDLSYIYGISHTYQWDETGHWYVCAWCGKGEAKSAHRVKCNNPSKCTVCGATNCTTAPEHGKYVKAHDKTQHWEECEDCGAIKEDSIRAHYVICTAPGVCTKCGSEGCTNTPDHYFLRWERNPSQHWWFCQQPSCDYVFRGDHFLYCDSNKCQVCNHLNSPNPRFHREEVTIPGKPATCTESGLTDGKKCTVCGTTTVEQTTISAKGHRYWGEWSIGGHGNHLRYCKNDCGKYTSTACEYLTASIGEVAVDICPICGLFGDIEAEVLKQAAITNPAANESGTFIARAALYPVENSIEYLAVVTAVYERNGHIVELTENAAAVTVNLPLPVNEPCQLVYVTMDEATMEQVLIPVEYTIENGNIVFTVNHLGLFLLIAE